MSTTERPINKKPTKKEVKDEMDFQQTMREPVEGEIVTDTASVESTALPAPPATAIARREVATVARQSQTGLEISDDTDYKLAVALEEANKLAFTLVDYTPVKQLHEENRTFFITDAAQVEIADPDNKAELLDRIVIKMRDTDNGKVYFTMFGPNHVRDRFPAIFTKFRACGKDCELGPFEIVQGKNKTKGNYPWVFKVVDDSHNFVHIFDRQK